MTGFLILVSQNTFGYIFFLFYRSFLVLKLIKSFISRVEHRSFGLCGAKDVITIMAMEVLSRNEFNELMSMLFIVVCLS